MTKGSKRKINIPDDSNSSREEAFVSSDSGCQNLTVGRRMRGVLANIKNKCSINPHLQRIYASISNGLSRSISHWRVLASGQILSFFLASTGGASGMLHTHCNLSAPTAQMALTYMMMGLHFTRVWYRYTPPENNGVNTCQNGKESRNISLCGKIKLLYPWRRKFDSEFVSDLELNHTLSDELHSDSDETGKSTERNKHVKTGAELQIRQSTGHDDNDLQYFCGRISLRIPLLYYIIFTLIHVEANYCIYLAFRYTTITSVSLLDNLSIVSAMVGSRLLLRRMYRSSHIIGAIVCVIGVVLNLLSDLKKAEIDPNMIDDDAYQDEEEEYPNRLTGDLIAIVGGLATGLYDVVIEFIVKDLGTVDEFLGIVGILGTIMSLFQALVLERNAVLKFFVKEWDDVDVADEYEDYVDPFSAPRTCSRSEGLILLAAYCIANYAFNTGICYFLTISESAFLTLSILTCDLWAVFFTMITEHVPPSPLFYIAFILVCIGVFIYETAPSPLVEDEKSDQSLPGVEEIADEKANGVIS